MTDEGIGVVRVIQTDQQGCRVQEQLERCAQVGVSSYVSECPRKLK